MSTLVLKGVPEELRRELKDRAEAHRRSMTQEAIGILETALRRVSITPPAKALKPRGALRMGEIVRMVREGRS